MLIESYKAIHEAGKLDKIVDAQYWAQDEAEKEAARTVHGQLMDNAQLAFDALAETRLARAASVDATKVFTPILLNYPADHSEGLVYLAELSRQQLLPTRMQQAHRVIRRVRLFEADRDLALEQVQYPGTDFSISGLFSEVTNNERPVLLDSTNTEPITSNTRQLETFSGLLNDVVALANDLAPVQPASQTAS